MEKCSTAILSRLPEKKKDPGYPAITCSIGAYTFDHTFYDLSASVSVMAIDMLNIIAISPPR